MTLLLKTKAEYGRRYKGMVCFAERKLGRVARPIEVVEHMLARHGELSPASIRMNRSALLFGLADGAGRDPRYAIHFEVAIAALKKVDEGGRRAGPTPSQKADRKTSSRKRKTLTVEQAQAVAAALKVSKHLHAQLAADFLRFGPDLGLRPAEWQTADVDSGRMYLHNAKHTHGRSCGPERILELDAYPVEYRRDLQAFLERIRDAVSGEPKNWDKVAEGVNRALRAACEAARIASLKALPIVLYTLRHVATARMKAARGEDGKSARFSRVEIAAMLGHISPDTAETHYARRHTGRGWREMPTRPSPENVAIVMAALPASKAQPAAGSASTGPRP